MCSALLTSYSTSALLQNLMLWLQLASLALSVLSVWALVMVKILLVIRVRTRFLNCVFVCVCVQRCCQGAAHLFS